MRRQGASVDVGTRNVEIVRGTYDALNRRDLDRLIAMFDEDFELHDHGTGFIQRGHDQYRKWLTEYFESWENYRETPEQLIPVEDRVLACVKSQGRGKLSGADMVDQHGEIHTLQDGRIVRADVYPTYGLAVKAAGFDDPEQVPTARSAESRGGRFRRWRR